MRSLKEHEGKTQIQVVKISHRVKALAAKPHDLSSTEIHMVEWKRATYMPCMCAYVCTCLHVCSYTHIVNKQNTASVTVRCAVFYLTDKQAISSAVDTSKVTLIQF